MDIFELAADLFLRRIDCFIGATTAVKFVAFGRVFFSAFSALVADATIVGLAACLGCEYGASLVD